LNQKLARVTREASHTQEDESEDENYQTAREDNYAVQPNEGQSEDDDVGYGGDGSEIEDAVDNDAAKVERQCASGMSLERTLTTRSRTMPFTKDETVAIRCMHVLHKTKAPLATYDDIMEWHLKEKKPSPATKHLVRQGSFLEKGVQEAAKTLQCKPQLLTLQNEGHSFLKSTVNKSLPRSCPCDLHSN
jgi:hypothetical protein